MVCLDWLLHTVKTAVISVIPHPHTTSEVEMLAGISGRCSAMGPPSFSYLFVLPLVIPYSGPPSSWHLYELCTVQPLWYTHPCNICGYGQWNSAHKMEELFIIYAKESIACTSAVVPCFFLGTTLLYAGSGLAVLNANPCLIRTSVVKT